jgi:hypothetical protein
MTKHTPRGTSATPWGALPIQQATTAAEDAQKAYLAAFKRYHTTKTHEALLRLKEANHARFMAGAK